MFAIYSLIFFVGSLMFFAFVSALVYNRWTQLVRHSGKRGKVCKYHSGPAVYLQTGRTSEDRRWLKHCSLHINKK